VLLLGGTTSLSRETRIFFQTRSRFTLFLTCYDLRVSASVCDVRKYFQSLGDMDPDLHTKRIRRAAQSLEGLSCGDAFGERFFLPDAVAKSMIQERAVPAPPWFFTDDTVMALSILETLAEHRQITRTH
jgi:hypothetical protein